MAECKSEDQWAKGHKALYRKFLLAKSDRFPPRDHPLTLSEWFVIHHKTTWAPFIQKEVKLIRYFQLFNDYRYLHKLPEVQLGQFQTYFEEQECKALRIIQRHASLLSPAFYLHFKA
ncbi:hypothetical protein Taro_022433 [Colocasia esculenta]|uniref:Uncharacterized protein n=1 Tax=Colocasia esculenta TaxID=4460 RepID=A0A843VBB1_COLES|nr:hypothetical protein [Colocasia esculenta]